MLSVGLLVVMASTTGETATGDQAAPIPQERFSVDSSPQLGPTSAPVTIVEFADFQCRYCLQGSRTVHRLLEHYPGKVRWVFKHFPLRPNPQTDLPHLAAIAALEQGKFWEMHNVLFANQGRQGRDDLVGYAEQLQLERAAFVRALHGRRLGISITRDVDLARSLGVAVTPTYFINGRRLIGAQRFGSFRQIVDQELAAAPAAARDQ